MADVTVKRLEDFEAIFGGGFRRVRAGLGVTSFGIAVMELPPSFADYPEHDQAHDDQEEVYTVLRGSATLHRRRRASTSSSPASGSGSGPDELRKIEHRRRAGAGARDRRHPRRRLRRARVHRGGRARTRSGSRPGHGQPLPPKSGLAEQVLVARVAAAPRRRPGRRRRCASGPRRRSATTGTPEVLSRTRSAAAATWSATAIAVAARGRPWASARPRQSSSATSPAQPIATSAWPEPPRAAEAVGDHDRGPAPRRRRRSRPGSGAPRRRGPRAAGRPGLVAGHVRGVDAGVGADPAVAGLDDQHPALGADHAARLGEDQLDQARVLVELGGELARALAGIDLGEAPAGPRPSRRPSARSRRRGRRRARSPPRRRPSAISSPSPVARPDLGQARERRRSRAARAHSATARSARSRAELGGGGRGALGPLAEHLGERGEVVGGVEVERQRRDALRPSPRSPARSARSRWRSQAAARRRPGRSRRRAPSAGRWCRCRGGRGRPRRVPGVSRSSAASSSAGSSSGQSPGSRATRSAPCARARTIPSVAASRVAAVVRVAEHLERRSRRGVRARARSAPRALAGDHDHPLDPARRRSTEASTSASIALTIAARCGRSSASSSRCLASPKRLTGMIAVAFTQPQARANSSTRSASARRPGRALHQGRAGERRELAGRRVGIAVVDDDRVDQALVERGDPGGAQRPPERGDEGVGRALDRAAADERADRDDRRRRRRRSPRACPAPRGSARSRSPGSRGRSRSPRRRRSPPAPRGSGTASAIPSSSTASIGASPRSRIRNSCRPRQPAGVRTRVRTGCSHIGSTRGADAEGAGDLRLGVGEGAALGEEVGAVEAGGEVAVGEPEPAGGAERAPAARRRRSRRRGSPSRAPRRSRRRASR